MHGIEVELLEREGEEEMKNDDGDDCSESNHFIHIILNSWPNGTGQNCTGESNGYKDESPSEPANVDDPQKCDRDKNSQRISIQADKIHVRVEKLTTAIPKKTVQKKWNDNHVEEDESGSGCYHPKIRSIHSFGTIVLNELSQVSEYPDGEDQCYRYPERSPQVWNRLEEVLNVVAMSGDDAVEQPLDDLIGFYIKELLIVFEGK